MDMRLSGKRVLVTGGSRGIGAAIAERMLEEGADVRIVARSVDPLRRAEERLRQLFGASRVSSAACDCRSGEALESLAADVKRTWGRLDVVVAAVGDGRSVADPLPGAQQWASVWSENFESALLTSRAFLPMLIDARGSLLFISSIAGKEALGAPVDYSTAKAAVAALAKNMARKLGRQIRVNVLAPGNVHFDGGSWDAKLQKDPEGVARMLELMVPMQRFGTPGEMADAAVFLCSDRASFITGSVLVVDGGQTAGIF